MGSLVKFLSVFVKKCKQGLFCVVGKIFRKQHLLRIFVTDLKIPTKTNTPSEFIDYWEYQAIKYKHRTTMMHYSDFNRLIKLAKQNNTAMITIHTDIIKTLIKEIKNAP